MRRQIVILLVLLCILLSACGKPEPAQEAPTQEELAYQQALELFEQGDYTAAATIFTGLGSYQGSQYMLSEINMAQKYDEAMALVAAQKYPEAFRALSELGDYKDVAQQLQRFRAVEITIDNWQEYFEFLSEDRLVQNNAGEYVQAYFTYSMQMKDGVFSRIYDFARNNVAITVAYQKQLMEFSLDPQSGIYSIEQSTNSYSAVFPYTKPLLFVGNQQKIIIDDSSTVDFGPEGYYCEVRKNFRVNEAQGYLFLYE